MAGLCDGGPPWTNTRTAFNAGSAKKNVHTSYQSWNSWLTKSIGLEKPTGTNLKNFEVNQSIEFSQVRSKPINRRWFYVSPAKEVGLRRTKVPVILEIDAEATKNDLRSYKAITLGC